MLLEPSPDFHQPHYTASLWYRMNKAKTVIAVTCTSVLTIVLSIFLTRRQIFEISCRLVWPLISLLNDRRRIAWLAQVIDIRLYLAGSPRPAGTIQRTYLLNPKHRLPSELTTQMHRFFNESDQLCFGGTQSISREGSSDTTPMESANRQLDSPKL